MNDLDIKEKALQERAKRLEELEKEIQEKEKALKQKEKQKKSFNIAINDCPFSNSNHFYCC